jgi:hypothetical protein
LSLFNPFYVKRKNYTFKWHENKGAYNKVAACGSVFIAGRAFSVMSARVAADLKN